MPIYEFYCADCHTVYSFFTPTANTERRPDCPHCERSGLERRPSRFATLKHRHEEGDPARDPFAGLDESRLEGAMDSLMREMGRFDEDDPRAMGHFLRRFSQETGLELGGRMEELMRRMEAGEDPEALEAELEGDLGDGEEDSLDDFFRVKKALAERRRPRVDEELYFF